MLAWWRNLRDQKELIHVLEKTVHSQKADFLAREGIASANERSMRALKRQVEEYPKLIEAQKELIEAQKELIHQLKRTVETRDGMLYEIERIAEEYGDG